MNAQIGREDSLQLVIKGLIKKTNNSGRRLVNFAAFRNMVIGSIMLEHKNIHKMTWRSLDGQYINRL
jgi:hypothetical protein